LDIRHIGASGCRDTAAGSDRRVHRSASPVFMQMQLEPRYLHMSVGQTSELRSFAKGPDRMAKAARWHCGQLFRQLGDGDRLGVPSDVDMCIRLLQAFGSSTVEGCDGCGVCCSRTRRALALSLGGADEIPKTWVRNVLCPGYALPCCRGALSRDCLSPLRALFFPAAGREVLVLWCKRR
jgi:hypothetical protein